MKLISATTCLLISLSLTGCLKTRAQLRGDAPDSDSDTRASSRPVPAQVQEVQPQGAYVMDELKSEMTRLNGRIEDLERSNQQSQQDKTAGAGKPDQIRALETRIVELEQAQATMLEAIKKNQSQALAVETGDAFEKGKNQYDAKNYDGAVDSFTLYLKDPKGKHVEEATFLRGESYHALGQHKKAIIDYSKFPEKYTNSRRMPQALYKIGLSFESLGMKEDAKGFYQELNERFPKSPEAKKVRGKVK
ncbi:MAG: tetratricopeptide repeat protein [Methylotenera sp.]|nr:tetratricopeptide repeat protein [Oligoflexia bacterium]